MLLGLLGAAVPLAVHLIGARRAQRVPFAALHFLLSSDRKLARRLELRQLLLLLVRTLMVAALALMMAKPHLQRASLLPAFDSATRRVVLVLDDTASMFWRQGGTTVFSIAQQKARTLAREVLGRGGRVAVLSASNSAGPLPRLSADPSAVLSAISRVEPTHRHASVLPAIFAAKRLIETGNRGSAATAGAKRGKIVVLSDWAAHGLALEKHASRPPKADQSSESRSNAGRFRKSRLPHKASQASLPKEVVVPSLGLPTKRENRAVTKLWARQGVDAAARSTRLYARVCAYDAPAGPQRVQLIVDGQGVATRQLKLPSRGCGDVGFEHTFSRGGSHEVAVQLPSDGFLSDNRRYLRLEVLSDMRVLLVNGAPSPVRHLDELFYLQAALEVRGRDQRGIAASVATATEIPALDGYDVVMLCNVGALASDVIARLKRFVRAGGGLLVTLGDQVDALAYSRYEDLLAQPLRGVAFHRGLQLGNLDQNHPMLSGLSDKSPLAGLSKARFRRYFRLRAQPDPSRRVVLTLEDGAPALVERSYGEGKLALFVSSIDTDWNDISLRPGFLPLIQRLTRFLGRAPLDTPAGGIKAGWPRPIIVRESWRRIFVRGPAAIKKQYAARQLTRKARLEIDAPLPGFYRLQVEDREGRRHPLRRAGFAANLDPRESDLKMASRKLSQKKAGKMRKAMVKLPLWPYLGGLMLLLLVCESLVARRR
jgi:hypothetical protein